MTSSTEAAPVAAGGKAKIKLRRSVVDKINALNQGAALPKPIRLGAVATVLSALQEADALALLDAVQELDPADPCGDPTVWICREAAAKAKCSAATATAPARAAASKVAGATAASADVVAPGKPPAAGGDVGAGGAGEPAAGDAAAQGGATGGAAAEAAAVPEAPKKVKLKKKVVDRIKALNAEGGGLLAPLRLGTIAGPLAEMEESVALSLLEQLEEDAESIADPTAWIVGAAKGESLAAEMQDEEWKEWEQWEADKAGELADLLSAPVLERVRSINRQIILETPLVLVAIAGPLALLEDDVAIAILDEVEAKAAEIEEPTRWVIRLCRRKAGKVMGRVDELNKTKVGNVFLLSRLVASEVRGPLMAIPESAALRLLSELEKRCHDIEDPTKFIKEGAEKELSGNRVALLMKKIRESGSLCSPMMDPGKVLDALLELSEPMAVGLLYDLKKRAKHINKPTGWMLAEIQRRTNVGAASAAPWKQHAGEKPASGAPGLPGKAAAAGPTAAGAAAQKRKAADAVPGAASSRSQPFPKKAKTTDASGSVEDDAEFEEEPGATGAVAGSWCEEDDIQ
mmetsp:Transcript_13816/g.35806  ORF Transcript_13816/g.35806 Transcript_13816/m.35806 type:complete len:573 (+) Transcript_13816:3-1721(+)|eukprot:CAMPEP_0183510374 /NCGR_PEP_ID=MMETSP0371-20130417/10276_1 /TAXON_ID=268820 /ORGANISM="Peridinium aciculiferum, Strain PAER-2" /LENGTH=572 /DNA_ID=CAMNT_0025707185 /DNA_START=1 /DNA_END=1719 /DNA_ORIENTATION=-